VRAIAEARRPGDVVVASLHWGGNWGYTVSEEQREFAHALIDSGAVEIVHGHSSHHAKGVEIYRGRPVLYGCGDFINDYEGISGYRGYRPDLALAYFVTIDSATGATVDLRIETAERRNFTLEDPARADVEWVRAMLDREGRPFGTAAELGADGALRVIGRA
jgi:poly-gamma-glutamate synthesis protein (capsule biosynthesis protein)